MGSGYPRKGTLFGVPIVATEVALPHQCDDRGKVPLFTLVVGDGALKARKRAQQRWVHAYSTTRLSKSNNLFIVPA